MLDLAINLGHGFFAAHRENRMTQSDQNSDKTDRVRKRRVLQPTQCIVGIDKVGEMRPWRDLRATHRERVDAPRDHQHHHHGRDVHDAQGFLAGFGNAFDVFPPEVDGHKDGKEGRSRIHRKLGAEVKIREDFVHQAGQI